MEGGDLKIAKRKKLFSTKISEKISLEHNMSSCIIDNVLFLSWIEL